MSVFGGFQEVWSKKYPHSALPAAWEEDIRANLHKHKQKVSTLREELEKEEIYVEYLERLLSDIEENKKSDAVQENNNPTTIVPDGNDEHLSKDSIEQLSDNEQNSANKCINELSMSAKFNNEMIVNDLNNAESESDVSSSTCGNRDLSSFVTVIEVNGLKSTETSSQLKCVPPPKPPPIKARSISQQEIPSNRSSMESLKSSTEHTEITEEPYYDIVATDCEESDLVKSISSSTENVFTTSSTLPIAVKHNFVKKIIEPQSPDTTSNYVNIEYFIHGRSREDAHSSSEDEENRVPVLRRSVDESSYASSSSLDSSTPSSRRKFNANNDLTNSKQEDDTMFRCILLNIIDSETNYVDWLNILLQYMKAIKAAVGTSQSVITETEFKTIFYKIPELHTQHSNFLDCLKRYAQKWEGKIGDSFKNMALNLNLYGAFLSNYGRAVDTVRKCSVVNTQFREISKKITCKWLSEQPISLEDLLHKPVARMQKNALALNDLYNCTPKSHPDYNNLADALQLTQQFLDQFNMIQTKSMFPSADRAQRRLVKNSFIVEFADGQRKLRHLFLFNDVIACAKYKSFNRKEKYTFELKWFIPVEDIYILEESVINPHEVSSSNIVALKSQASTVRDQLRQEEKASEEKKLRIGKGSEKFKKRLMELESQLVLVSPNLIFRLKHKQTQKNYMFFLSSEFERTQWIEAIQTLQQTSTPPAPSNSFTMFELQTWITACRSFLKTNMGSYLLRTGHDESLLVGDLHVTVLDMKDLEYTADLYICIEVDFYGHFFRKAKTKLLSNTNAPSWNETFVIDLEGCENMRILVFRENVPNNLFGKQTLKLSRQWLGQSPVEKKLMINNCELRVILKYIPYEVTLRRVPTGKVGSLFGEKIQVVCKRQKRDIPFIVSACIREVERRGMSEIGIYRVSGSASDLAKLKKSFETNSYEAEQLLKEVDIHSVTGILRLYLRELPEALFTDQLYPVLLESFNQSEGNLVKRHEQLKQQFYKLSQQNKATIQYILDHLIRINQHENENKMSLHNLATVFGPTLLRPSSKVMNFKEKDSLASSTVDVMAQAGILYCYLLELNSRKDC